MSLWPYIPYKFIYVKVNTRGGSRNSSIGGGSVLGRNSSRGGVRVQVHRNFHTDKQKQPLRGV